MELDGGWGAGRGEADWGKIADADPMGDREVNISDLEIDLSK
jgi:hypothetical protein